MARSANSSMAWTLIHDATEPAVYLRSLIFKDVNEDRTEQLGEALLYFRRAQASNVLRSYFGRFSGWRVVPVWS